MQARTAETLAWVLIYSGLLLVVLGLAVHSFATSSSPWLAWSLMGAGALDAALGVGLIVWRSRMNDSN